jgi:hypothetical protein
VVVEVAQAPILVLVFLQEVVAVVVLVPEQDLVELVLELLDMDFRVVLEQFPVVVVEEVEVVPVVRVILDLDLEMEVQDLSIQFLVVL